MRCGHFFSREWGESSDLTDCTWTGRLVPSEQMFILMIWRTDKAFRFWGSNQMSRTPLFNCSQEWPHSMAPSLCFYSFYSVTFSFSVQWNKYMFLASLLRKRPCTNRMRLQSPNESVPLMFWHFRAWNTLRRQRGFSLHCLDVCLWVGARLYVLAQSLV